MGGGKYRRQRRAERDLVHKTSGSSTGRARPRKKPSAGRRGARRRRTGAPLAGYVRVSTTEQGEHGAGLEAQLVELTQVCAGRGLALGPVFKDVASGGSLAGRRDLRRALAAVRRGEASGIVVPRLDRLSRSVYDFSWLLRRSRREGWQLVLADLGLDLTSPTGELIAVILAALAEFERRLIGLNTRKALAIKKAQGVRLGRPAAVPAAVREQIRRERAAGHTWRHIADSLNRRGVSTAHQGVRWYASTARAATLNAKGVGQDNARKS